MGLIRKQVGLDLKDKIEKWIDEYLGPFSRYTISEDYRIKMERDDDSWYVILRLVRPEVEIPDYISFVFNKEIDGTLWNADIERMLDLLNKYSNLFHNLNYLTFTNYTPWQCIGKIIEISKIDEKFIRV